MYLPLIRTTCGAALLLLAAALADPARAEWAVVSASEVRPGEVVVRIDHGGEPAPQAGRLSLRLAPGVVATAEHVEPAEAGSAALMLCLDRSGSMTPRVVAEMRSALRQVLQPPGATGALPVRLGIFAFGTRSTYLLPPGTDRAAALKALDLLVVERGGEGRTRLHDAVAGGLVELRATGATSKRLVVVSDGNDEGSDLPASMVLQRAGTAPSIAIDAIGFGAQATAASGSLAALSKATGGRFTVAADTAALVAALKGAFAQAASPSQVDVTFRYAPAVGDAMAVEATLVATAADGNAREWSIAQPIAAPATPLPPNAAPVALPSEAGGAAGGPRAGSWRTTLGIGLSLLLVLAALVALVRRGRSIGVAPDTALPVDADDPSPLDDRPPPRPRPPTLVASQWALPEAGRCLVVLEMTSGAERGRRYEVTTAVAAIGSAADNQVVVADDDFMSGHHAELRAGSGALYVADLGSTNGSELNGRRFKGSTRSLSPDDHLVIGRTAFRVLSPGPARVARTPEATR